MRVAPIRSPERRRRPTIRWTSPQAENIPARLNDRTGLAGRRLIQDWEPMSSNPYRRSLASRVDRAMPRSWAA
jgi:hypothetical protein